MHANDGVGNKTAYLISQGGTFNGQTITGIDAGDTGLAKTGRLYLETIPRLTSGAEYADLGRVLGSHLRRARRRRHRRLHRPPTATRCATAVAATELALAARPTRPPPHAEAPVTCPTGAPRMVDAAPRRRRHAATSASAFGCAVAAHARQRRPVVRRAAATSSLFAWDPDPDARRHRQRAADQRRRSWCRRRGRPYLNFHHAYVFEWYDAEDGNPAYYRRRPGARPDAERNGTWTTRHRAAVGQRPRPVARAAPATKVFGGDSHGYGSSRVDLTSLAGQTVRVVFRVDRRRGRLALSGWWVDDIRLYSCAARGASVPRRRRVAARRRRRQGRPGRRPPYVGSSPVASYRITRSDGKVNTARPRPAALTLTGLSGQHRR